MRILRFLSALLMVFIMNAANAAPLQEAELYPYVVPAAYYPHGTAAEEAAGVVFRLGHNLYVALVRDHGGLVHNVSPEELTQAHLTAAEARDVALRNLKAAVATGTIKAEVFEHGPQGRPFILFGGHWLAASCILLPDLYELASKPLGTADIVVSVPNRDAMLVFAKGDASYRQAMRNLIREKESDSSKPLTFKLFSLTTTGLIENDGE